jgi:capsular polysaccharide transport system permease protein
MSKMVTKQGSLRTGFSTQIRVIQALILREVITRYGRHNLGFAWLLAEPILFTLGVVTLWTLTHGAHGFRLDIAPFIVTGYSSMLLWRNCSFRGINAIEPNRSLLHHRYVKVLDVFMARMLLEIAGVSASFLTLLTTMISLGFIEFPQNPILLLYGWVLMAWLSACLGIFLGCLSTYSELVERLWHPISYFLLPMSGVFFMADWLPQTAQDFVLWMPLIHPVEMMRAGYWGESIKAHYSMLYIIFINLFLTLITLAICSDKKMRTSS